MNTYEPGQKVLITLGEKYHDLVGFLYPSNKFEATYVREGNPGSHVVCLNGYADEFLDHLYFNDSEVRAIEHTPTVAGTEVSKEELKAHLEMLAFCVGEVPSGVNREEGDRAIEAVRAALFPEEVAGA